MKKYRIFDVRGEILAEDCVVFASSPIQAVRKFYKNVKRVRNGDIVVNNRYCYMGELRQQETRTWNFILMK